MRIDPAETTPGLDELTGGHDGAGSPNRRNGAFDMITVLVAIEG
jgi:hypothetical protein